MNTQSSGGRSQIVESSIAARLSEFVHATVGGGGMAVPTELAHAVRRQVLDAVGIAAASTAAQAGQRLSQLSDPPRGVALVLGSEGMTTAREAAFRNGTLIHGLDFDDTYQAGIVHVGAVIIPTVLAVSQEFGSSDREVVAAIAAGYELHSRLGEAAAGKFHLQGFHATPVCGVLAAAAVASALRGLSVRQTVDAIGIAGSFSGGLQQFLDDGADTKRLHPGWAAQGGIAAAELAAAGFDGPTGVIEGRYGVYATHVGLSSLKSSILVDDLGSTWNVTRMAVKPYPCCHLLHACIDAARLLKAEHQFRSQDVVSIVASVSETGMKILTEPRAEKVRPTTSYSAQFSLPFAVAAALTDSDVTLESFSIDRIQDPELHRLAELVECRLDADSEYPKYFDGSVEIVLNDGRILRHREKINRGSVERPLTDRELVQKFVNNMAYGGANPKSAESLAGGLLFSNRGVLRFAQEVNEHIVGDGSPVGNRATPHRHSSYARVETDE